MPSPSNPANPSSRGVAAGGDNKPFARQLETQREARARDSARPAAPAKNPAPPALAERGQHAPKPAGSQRAESTHDEPKGAARLPAPRNTEAANQTEPADSKAVDPVEQPAGIETNADAGITLVTDWLARLGPAPETPPQADAPMAAPQPTVPMVPTPPSVPAAPPIAATGASPDPELTRIAGRSPSVDAPATTPATAPQGRLPAPADARDPVVANEWQRAQAAAMSDTFQSAHEAPGQHLAEPGAPPDASFAAPSAVGTASAVPLTGKTAESAPPLQLATPITSPEFRAALGMQVSVLARGGVQQAELHLNPAEMGPVSIQIVLDGQQAQVNFGADSALTRQIIESGMPELASALREAGLTLTGGGVSQHAGGQRQDPGPQGTPGAARGDAHAATPTEVRTDAQLEQARRSALRSASGGVDLYA